MYNKILEDGFWWLKMRSDLKQVVQKCMQCLQFDTHEEGYHPAKSITAEQPWDHIEIDLIGPLPSSQKGHTYILTVVDVCMGYVVLRALKTRDMEMIARKLALEDHV